MNVLVVFGVAVVLMAIACRAYVFLRRVTHLDPNLTYTTHDEAP